MSLSKPPPLERLRANAVVYAITRLINKFQIALNEATAVFRSGASAHGVGGVHPVGNEIYAPTGFLEREMSRKY